MHLDVPDSVLALTVEARPDCTRTDFPRITSRQPAYQQHGPT